jgi:hypothetical protein
MIAAVALAALALVQGTPRADRLGTDDGVAQRVVCGHGADLVTADRLDRVAADCETVTRRIFVDPTGGDWAQHATVVEPDSAASGPSVVAVFQVGRRRPGGGAAAIGFSASSDAGRTWRSGLLPGVRGSETDFVSDPAVVRDPVHGTWLTASLFGAVGIGNGLYVSRSPDGRTWTPPVTAAASPASELAFDKEWLACDSSLGSQFRGRCYLAYTNVLANAIAVIFTDDGGVTWSQPGAVASPERREEVVGAQPAVLPDGTLVVAYTEGDAIRSAVSHDGGASFASIVDAATPTRGPVGFRPGGLVLPSVEVGGDGTIRMVWADARFRGLNDVAIASSRDGLTWTDPARVPAVPGGDAFIPAVAADPASSRLAIVTYRIAPGGADAFVVGSRDGGATWTAPRRLSARTVAPTWVAGAPQPFVGDYVSVEFAGARFVPVVVLATPPAPSRLREGAYTSSIAAP